MFKDMMPMRSENEMCDLILGFARSDDRVRGVILNGSRANPHAPRDKYQDYDIVYIVREFDSFLNDQSFLNIFGERLMLQMPETMREPCGGGFFNWLMLFNDGNRLDLTIIPVEKPELISKDSQSIVLLDKDGSLPHFDPPSDKDYLIKPPSELFYLSCCNNFWWCLQNVAKGIARDELPYAMEMYNSIVGLDLKDMINWYIGIKYNFKVSAGKMGKYYKKYLSSEIYEKYMSTYTDGKRDGFWKAVFAACALFGDLAREVGNTLGYIYNQQDEYNMLTYLKGVMEEMGFAAVRP